MIHQFVFWIFVNLNILFNSFKHCFNVIFT
nr:MAG TPA: hypothetical protein [Caudoviricetes sp.]